MLDTPTKKRIDDCRDILVGKLPDPKAQIEQITIALIYKFMDDMDKEAIELGGKAKFFSDYFIPDLNNNGKKILVEFEKFGWDNLFDAKVTASQMLALYSEAITAIDKNPNIPQLFRDIFKNAFLPYRDPETLKLFLKTISEFEYTHSEKLGDAFEYLLSVMGSQGDAGQFRTPRHIIDFLVAVVDPQKTDNILDPACGTAGFLISAFKHILLKDTKGNKENLNIFQYNNNYGDEKPFNNLGDQLTPDDHKKVIRNFTGYDISPDMVRLSRVNLYLHGFSNPHIFEYDTLTSEDRWNETFDVILANPPFMSPKGGIRPHKKFSISSNRSEVLFVDYIAEHLNPRGRAGIIVPEGVIFQSGTAYKELRRSLVENYLYAVVSLPSGVFNPYSGVKTSILLMDKELAKTSEEILFVKIDNDGFGLGAQRNAVKGGQLDNAVEVIRSFAETRCIASQFESMAHAVPKAEIAKNGDYNLSGERYKNQQRVKSHSFETIEVGEIMEFQYGKPLKQENRIDGGFPVYGSNGIVGWHNEFIAKAPFIVVGRKGSAGALHYSEKNGYPIDTTFYIENKVPDKLNLKYAYNILSTLNLDKVNIQAGVPGLNRNDAYKLQIPLPHISVQEEIVAEIEGYQKIIDGAKMVVENYKPKIDIDPEWEMVELGSLCDFVRGPFGGSLKKEIFVNEGFVVYEQSHAIYNRFDSFRYFIDGEKFKEMQRFEVYPNDIIMSCSGTMGKVAIIPKSAPTGIINQALLKLTTRKELLPSFLKLWMESENFQSQLHSNVQGAAIVNVASVSILKELKIPYLSIETQLKIVSIIEKEQGLVNASKQLIEIFEQKIKERIGKVWGKE